MNIQEIKAVINAKTGAAITTLMLSQQKDLNNVPTPWLTHWEQNTRVRVTFPLEVAETINADKAFAGLALKEELVAEHTDASGKLVAAYTRFIVITPSSVVMTF